MMETTNEHALALAVLQQATRDAALPLRDIKRAERRNMGMTTCASITEISEAREFWTAEEGEWAESRRMWCDMANIDEQCARTHALRAIAVSLGGCITRRMEHRAVLEGRTARYVHSDKRRALAAQAYAKWRGGQSQEELRREYQMDRRQMKALLALGKLHANKAT